MTSPTTTTRKRSWNPPKFGLAIDWETSGYSYPNYAEKHQGISVGAAVVELKTLEIAETWYREIQFDETKYLWDEGAEKIHGVSRAHLAQHGVTQEQAALELANLVVKYWFNQPVMIIGHNPNFDVAFTRQLLEPFGVMFEVFFRLIDTSAAGVILYGTPYSDDIFKLAGLPDRGAHNALEDVLMTLEAIRVMRQQLIAGKHLLNGGNAMDTWPGGPPANSMDTL